VIVSTIIALSMTALGAAEQQRAADLAGPTLLDQLAGHWTMTGMLGGKRITHDVDAEWVLKHEYLRFHEVSGDKDKTGTPAYEAIVFISWDTKANEYRCLWLDNTSGVGLSAPIARGKKSGDAIALVFTQLQREALHTTFSYDRSSDTWRITIDDVTGSKTDHFGDVKLGRAK